MTCDEVRDRLSERIDGALERATEAEIAEHLAGCEACRRELARLEQTVAGLRALGDVRAPAGFVDRVLAGTRRERWIRRAIRAAFVPLPRKLPLEAAAVLLIGILTVVLYRGTPDLQRASDQPEVRARAKAPASDVVKQEDSPASPETRRSDPAAPPASASESSAKEAPLADARSPRPAPTPAQTPPPARAPRADRDVAASAERDQPPPDTAAERQALSKSSAAPPPPSAPVPVPDPVAREKAIAPPAASAPPATESAPAPPAMGRLERGGSADVLQRAAPGEEARPRAQSPARLAPQVGLTAAVPPPLRGMLRVGDRTASERALRDLVGRLGATALWDRPEPDAVTITAPRALLPDLLAGLRELGELRLEPAPGDLPDRVTLVLRLGS